MPQIYDMGHTVLLLFRRQACWGFFCPEKSWRLRTGFNPRTWVLKGSQLPLDHRSRLKNSYCVPVESIRNWFQLIQVPILHKPVVVAGVFLSVPLPYLLMSYYRAFLYLYPEHCNCHRNLWGTKAAGLSVTIKEIYSVYMCKHPGSFINPLTPNDHYSGRTAPLISKVAFYIFIQQI
jgi:hypothetical protein